MFVLVVFFMVSMTLAGEWVAVCSTFASVAGARDCALSLVHHGIRQLLSHLLSLSLALIKLLVQLLLAFLLQIFKVLFTLVFRLVREQPDALADLLHELAKGRLEAAARNAVVVHPELELRHWVSVQVRLHHLGSTVVVGAASFHTILGVLQDVLG